MKFILIITVLSSCFIISGEGVIKHDYNKSFFIRLMHDAYAITYQGRNFVTGNYFDRKTCIYGSSPNAISKKRIDSIYSFFINEFDVLHAPIYVDELKACPNSSNFFILLHEDLFDRSTKLRELNKVEVFLGRKKSKNKKFPSGLASTYTMFNRGSFIFIEIDQLTNFIDDHLYKSLLKSLILEELMQGVSGGNDLNITTIRMSILQEPHLTQLPYSDNYLQKKIGSKWHRDFYKRMMKAKAGGFCTFDLWFLELARLAHKKELILYQDYLELLDEKFVDIKAKAKEIEGNSDYSQLIEPRCSGENTGIDSKIGYEKYY